MRARAPSPLSLFHMDSLERCVLFGGQTHGRLISNQAGAGQAVMGLQKQTSIHVGDTSLSTIIVARNLAVPFTHNERKRWRSTSNHASVRGFVEECQKRSLAPKSEQKSLCSSPYPEPDLHFWSVE